MEKKERDSGLELLRILAIVLIFWMHGASSYSNNNLSAWLCIVIESVGNIGVALFILITGYFGIVVSQEVCADGVYDPILLLARTCAALCLGRAQLYGGFAASFLSVSDHRALFMVFYLLFCAGAA